MAGPLFFDRVMAESTTTGTGTYTLGSAVTGYQAWSVVGDGNTGYYCAMDVDGNGVPTGDWEVGLGTYTASGTTLARTTVLASTNANAAVSWAAGTRRIFLTVPASIGGSASRLVGSWTFSINVTELIFDVSTVSAFSVIVHAVTLGTSGRLQIHVSTDGGSTYHTNSGDYITLAITGIATNATSGPLLTSADATAARSGVWQCPASGVNGAVKIIRNDTRAPTDNASIALFVDGTLPITHIRISPQNGGNMTGGSIYVVGQK